MTTPSTAARWLLAALCAFAPQAIADCAATAGAAHFHSANWGVNEGAGRYQADTRITGDNVAALKLAWAFGLGESASPHAYPLVSEDTVFIGDEQGVLYALDKASGCERWRFEADGDIRTAIVRGRVDLDGQPRTLLHFGTIGASVYALDAETGEELWRIEADPHRTAIVTGTPSFHDRRLFVPLSAYEVILAVAPFYDCCSFRGSILALDAASGTELWRTHTIEEAPQIRSTSWFFLHKIGPSGAPVWSAPTVDPLRNAIYFGTGENYSDPPTATSDAIFSLDMDDGRVNWVRQFTAGDAWNGACGSGWLDANCPDANGPDLDFGAPPILTRSPDGQTLLLAGQKSGMVYAMNPDDGALIWQARAGRGGMLGGIHWGMAADPERGLLFVPVSDRGTGPSQDPAAPGLHALRLADGAPVWSAATDTNCEGKDGCYAGVSAAVLATDGLVFGGGLDGRLYAFDAETGRTLWRQETWRQYEAVNGIPTEGGAIDVHGPMVAGDMLFVTSGYRGFSQKAGNAFLAFKLSGD